MEYGRVDFVEEVKERETKRYNNHRSTQSSRKSHIIRAEIEDRQTAKSLGITLAELNYGGVYQ